MPKTQKHTARAMLAAEAVTKRLGYYSANDSKTRMAEIIDEMTNIPALERCRKALEKLTELLAAKVLGRTAKQARETAIQQCWKEAAAALAEAT